MHKTCFRKFSIKIGLKNVLVLKGRLGHAEKSDIHSWQWTIETLLFFLLLELNFLFQFPHILRLNDQAHDQTVMIWLTYSRSSGLGIHGTISGVMWTPKSSLCVSGINVILCKMPCVRVIFAIFLGKWSTAFVSFSKESAMPRGPKSPDLHHYFLLAIISPDSRSSTSFGFKILWPWDSYPAPLLPYLKNKDTKPAGLLEGLNKKTYMKTPKCLSRPSIR